MWCNPNCSWLALAEYFMIWFLHLSRLKARSQRFSSMKLPRIHHIQSYVVLKGKQHQLNFLLVHVWSQVQNELNFLNQVVGILTQSLVNNYAWLTLECLFKNHENWQKDQNWTPVLSKGCSCSFSFARDFNTQFQVVRSLIKEWGIG